MRLKYRLIKSANVLPSLTQKANGFLFLDSPPIFMTSANRMRLTSILSKEREREDQSIGQCEQSKNQCSLTYTIEKNEHKKDLAKKCILFF